MSTSYAVCNSCGGKGCTECHGGWECIGEGCPMCKRGLEKGKTSDE